MKEQTNHPNIDNFKIVSMEIVDKGDTKAVANIEYLGVLLRGFRIAISSREDQDLKKNIWIQVPSYKFAGRYTPLIKIQNVHVWRQLKQKIFKEYQYKNEKTCVEAATKTTKTMQDNSAKVDEEEEMSIEDIPF